MTALDPEARAALALLDGMAPALKALRPMVGSNVALHILDGVEHAFLALRRVLQTSSDNNTKDSELDQRRAKRARLENAGH